MAASKSVQLVVCAAVLLANLRPSIGAPVDSAAWDQYKRDFGKSYASPEEEAQRRELFTAEQRRIQAHNANDSSAYKLGLNRMSDWTQEEFDQMLGMEREWPLRSHGEQSSELSPFVLDLLSSEAAIPHAVDWRSDLKRVGAVKNQGWCGSCWAFAATGLLEGQQVARNFTKQLQPLSEQQLLDCIMPGDGCRGYWTERAITNVAEMGGIMSEQDYRYEAKDYGVCLMQEDKFVMTTKGYRALPVGDEDAMARAVARYGPIAVAVSAFSWRSYLSGIWPGSVCEGPISHAVLIVGYDIDSYGNKYWIVKNSWGDDHGEQGYIKIERGKNACKIASSPIIAEF